MWQKILLLALVISVSHQYTSAAGNDLVSFEKFEYTNQSMTELGFPEDNYSPSNFYTIVLTANQRVVRSSN